MFYNEDHLRITKIKTSDGRTPLVDEVSGHTLKKVIFAPLNKETKRLFEEENTRLPNGLKMKIEVVKAYDPKPVEQSPAVDVSEYEKKIAKLMEENKRLQIEAANNKTAAAVVDKSSEVVNTEVVSQPSTNGSNPKSAQQKTLQNAEK